MSLPFCIHSHKCFNLRFKNKNRTLHCDDCLSREMQYFSALVLNFRIIFIHFMICFYLSGMALSFNSQSTHLETHITFQCFMTMLSRDGLTIAIMEDRGVHAVCEEDREPAVEV